MDNQNLPDNGEPTVEPEVIQPQFQNNPSPTVTMSPTQPPGEVPQAPSTTQGNAKKSKKGLFIAVASISALIIAAVLAYFLILVPKQTTKTFSEKSASILKDLESSIKDLHDNNYVQMNEVVTDFDKAKKLLEQHQADFKNTDTKINSLNDQYSALKSTGKNAGEKKRADEAFATAKDIQKRYKTLLVFRDTMFQVYGELPTKLDQYVAAFRIGGPRDAFITQTQNIKDTTTHAINNMKNFKAEDDELPQYLLRLDYLNNVEKTFNLLNQDYITAKDSKLVSDLTDFSNKNIALNDQLKKAVDTYIADSQLTKDFASFADMTK